VGVPIKNAGLWTPKFLEELDKLRGVSRVVFIYGKSVDQTLDILLQWKDSAPHKVEIYKEPPLDAQTAHQLGPLYEDFQEALTQGKETHFLAFPSNRRRYLKVPREPDLQTQETR